MMRFRPRHQTKKTVDPDEIFLDARNLPSFDQQQFEDQLEKPIAKSTIYWLGFVFLLISVIFISKIGMIQIGQGDEFALRSERNRLRHNIIFPDRGSILDQTGEILAWSNNGSRQYLDQPGLAHVVGFLGLANEKELKENNYHPKELIGKKGVEKIFNSSLSGVAGRKIEEVDAQNQIFSDYLVSSPEKGDSVKLSIDSRIQTVLYNSIKNVAEDHGFTGGAGTIMNIKTGEVLSMVSYPEYEPNAMVNGQDPERIREFLNNEHNPFLNRAISGTYAPGSVVKPLVAVGVLAENIIDPETRILSTGTLSVPNPYHPDQPTVFRDWRAHGQVDLRRALAVSSNIYFYQVGGGYQDQPGLGISKINKYYDHFGLGRPTGINIPNEASGIIPDPEWKFRNFDGEPWRLGDTYHAAIGQFGMMTTPIQITRAIASIANDGYLVTPTVKHTDHPEQKKINWQATSLDLEIVREGLRDAVTSGTSRILNTPYVKVASKTGTAQIGTQRRYVNSWMTGFYPYDDPEWAFTVVMEKGPQNNQVGAGVAFRSVLDWMNENAPEYLGLPNKEKEDDH